MPSSTLQNYFGTKYFANIQLDELTIGTTKTNNTWSELPTPTSLLLTPNVPEITYFNHQFVYLPTVKEFYLTSQTPLKIEYDQNRIFITTHPPMISNPNNIDLSIHKISPLIEQQLPGFVRSEYSGMQTFLKTYYEFMEQRYETIWNVQKHLDFIDIDDTLDDYVEYFRKEFLEHIPRNILADKRKILKYIKQFYRAKGTEKSFKLFFRLLYGKEIEFYYPARDILKSSDGNWHQEISIRCYLVSGDPYNLVRQTVTGQNSQAYVNVDHVHKIQIGSHEVYELFINASSIVGDFQVGETIQNDAGTISLVIYGSLSGITITNDGEGYLPDDEITFTGSGYVGSAKVDAVGVSGEVESVYITEPGVGYSTPTDRKSVV